MVDDSVIIRRMQQTWRDQLARSGLNGEGGVDTSNGMTREEFDAKLAASEARQESLTKDILGEIKLLRSDMNGRLDTLTARVEGVERTTTGLRMAIVTTGVASTLAIAGILVGMLAYGGDQLGRGVDFQGRITSAVEALRQEVKTGTTSTPTPPVSPPPVTESPKQ